MQKPDYSLLLQPHDLACRHRGGCSQPQRFAGQRSLAAEFVRSPDCDDGFLAKLGNDGNFDLASVDVKNRIRWVSLRVDNLIFLIIRQGPSHVVLG